MSLFTTCIITTRSPGQADTFRELIRKRLDHGLYPHEIDFIVYPDPAPVGSGGATLLALEKFRKESGGETPENFFSDKKILILHAGGKSYRLPCYEPEGNLFVPLPVDSSSVVTPVALDLQLNLFLKYPWKTGEILVSSGDVVADFDTSSMAEQQADLCGFAVPLSFEQGSLHGVFKFDRLFRKVERFYQKESPEFLRDNAALEGTVECAVDMGLLSLSPAFAAALCKAGSIKSGSTTLSEMLADTKASFSLYLEIMTAALSEMDFSTFTRLIRNRTKLPESIQERFFSIFNQFALTAHLTRAASFFHLNSLREYLNSAERINKKDLRPFYKNDFEDLRVFHGPNLTVFNSINFKMPLGKHKPVIVENVKNTTLEYVLGDNLLIGLSELSGNLTVPENICIDQRHTARGPVVAVYSLDDTFERQSSADQIQFCGQPLTVWLSSRGLRLSDVFVAGDSFSLSEAKLYSQCTPEEDFLRGYWSVPQTDDWKDRFLSSRRYSIDELNENEDVLKREKLREIIRAESLRKRIVDKNGWVFAGVSDFKAAFKENPPIETLRAIYDSTGDPLLKSYRGELLETVSAKPIPETARILNEPAIAVTPIYKGKSPLADRTVKVSCPLRLDITGGWTDTPPFTFRHGGAVVNAAINIDGQAPIQVFTGAVANRRDIRLYSIDQCKSEIITSFEELENVTSAPNAFSVPKAVLLLNGFGKNSGYDSLSVLLDKIGYGLDIYLFCGVPKDSGLGASSITAASVQASLDRIFNNENLQTGRLSSKALQVEQMLGTGGGWQDQIGGIEGGIKFISSKPGLNSHPVIRRLNPSIFTDPRTRGLFTLFYTGITRPSGNLFSRMVKQMNLNTPSFNFSLNYLKSLAVDASEAISRLDLPAISEIVNSTWKVSARINPDAQSESIGRLFESVKPFYRGAKLMGAGGGGFALFISDSTDQALALREKLSSIKSPNSRLVDFSLDEKGIQVTVS